MGILTPASERIRQDKIQQKIDKREIFQRRSIFLFRKKLTLSFST